jgi:wyosine [tRNA(Phe)-imidazoG37] synthetase (radical SAM superfamily)
VKAGAFPHHVALNRFVEDCSSNLLKARRSEMSAVFGPVQSWRLGSTLGVDLVAPDRKYCSFDCVYCPGGGRTHGVTVRPWFVGLSALQALLESYVNEADCSADFVAFTGRGEPTLAGNLGEAIDLTRTLLDLPVAVLTNSSLVPRDDVKCDLAKADMVVAKLDAPDERLFRAINRPFVRYGLAEVVDGLRDFRRGFHGRFVIQTTVVDANKACIHKVAAIARELEPHELQLNWRLTDGTARAAATEVKEICSSFSDLNVTSPNTGGPSWERFVDVVQLQRSKRYNAEVMLMAAEVAVGAHCLAAGDGARLGG